MDHTEDIQKMLEYNPQHAMELIVEQYTGLVWKIIGFYLQNPEDIRDCVQDTFVEFYEKRRQFSPAKGTLSAYIGVIAKNRAISCYRRNKVRMADELSREIAGDGSAYGALEDKIDIERAIAALKPEDTEIIRMKYYRGMTIPEIADAMKLPYETVKKRHHRSIKKMRLLLMVLLVLMLLTACGYLLMRYFGILPGFGVNYDSDIPVFGLEEKNVFADEHYNYLLQDAKLWGDTLYLTLDIDSQDAGQVPFGETDTFTAPLLQGTLGFQLQSCGQLYSTSKCSAVNEENGTTHITLQFDLPIPAGEVQTLAMTLYFFDMEMPFVMKRALEETMDTYSYRFGEHGGLIAIPHWEEERLTVGLYPVSLREEATICPFLIRGMYMEGAQEEITLVSPDGTLLTGEPIPSSLGSSQYYEWDFGAAPAGKYTLHVPCVYLSMTLPETYTVSLDSACREQEEKVFDVPGGTLSLVSCEPLTEDEASKYRTIGEGEAGVYNYWLIKLQYEHNPDDDLWLSTLCMGPNCVLLPDESSVMLNYGSRFIEDEEASDIFTLVLFANRTIDPKRLELKSDDAASVRWMHSFDIPIDVEPAK